MFASASDSLVAVLRNDVNLFTKMYSLDMPQNSIQATTKPIHIMICSLNEWLSKFRVNEILMCWIWDLIYTMRRFAWAIYNVPVDFNSQIVKSDKNFTQQFSFII